MRFDISKFKCSISSFHLEELTGRQNIDALAQALGPNGGQGLNPFQMNVLHKNALVAMSITHVNEEPVIRPFTAWEMWNLRTQEFVVRAYDKLNDVSREEMDDFLSVNFGSQNVASTQSSLKSMSG